MMHPNLVRVRKHWKRTLSGHPFERRLLDLALATLALIVLSPALLAIAVAIRFTSAGRVCIFESRWGLWGQPIQLLKFRLRDEESHELTGLGRWLESWHLDELPTLLNVLRGDLSLVGPRALQPIHNPELANSPSLDALPGLTGLAQLRDLQGDLAVNPLDLDLQYLAHRTLIGDLGILLLTVWAIVRQPLHPAGVSIESRS